MKIERIKIRNYRSLRDVDLDMQDYTVLLGANGAGKSSVLYALNWFFNGGSLSLDDVYRKSPGEEIEDNQNGGDQQNEKSDQEPIAPRADSIEVAVTFSDLDDNDRRVLREYGQGDTAYFRRSWSSDGKEKMIGRAMQGPRFAEIRRASKAADIKALYKEVRQTIPSLADLDTKDAIFKELDRWESTPGNYEQLVEVNDSDAAHMFGFNGENTLSKRFRMVLVPAAADIAQQVGSQGRGSTLSTFVGGLLSAAVTAEREKWLVKFKDPIEELNSQIKTGVQTATGFRVERLNQRLQDLVPNASIELVPIVPEFTMKMDPVLNTLVSIDGIKNDVARQGHGVQRAIMMAMVQSLLPDQALEQVNGPVDSENIATNSANNYDEEGIEKVPETLPSFLIAIEEPEIYQHPLRARSFGRVLAQLAKQKKSQVVIATHSPYFVTPEQFESLHRFVLKDGCSETYHTTMSRVAQKANLTEDTVAKFVIKEVPRTFSEGFFTDHVVLVEGDTDRIVLETVAERQGAPLDTNGVAVIWMGGKNYLHIPYVILGELGIDVYVVADGDAKGASRKYPNDAAKQMEADVSHRTATEKLLTWLPRSAASYTYGAPTVVTEHWTIFEDDIEDELEKWSDFVAHIKTASGSPRSKNVLHYRSALNDVSISGCPENIKTLLNALYAMNPSSHTDQDRMVTHA